MTLSALRIITGQPIVLRMRGHYNYNHACDWTFPGNLPHPLSCVFIYFAQRNPCSIENMSVLAGCFSCFGRTSGLEEDVLSLLEEYSLTGCVVRARTTGYRLGESPYGFVDEVGLVVVLNLIVLKLIYPNSYACFSLRKFTICSTSIIIGHRQWCKICGQSTHSSQQSRHSGTRHYTERKPPPKRVPANV